MENLVTYPVNNVLFDAEDAELFHCTRTSGVFMGNDFTATAGGSDATVTVSEGLAWIRDAKFKGKAAALKSPATLSFTVSDSTYPRYDAITLRYDIVAGKTVIGVRPGSASLNPVKPSPVRSASLYELMLYHVYRPAGSSVITQDNIIDLRNNSEYCGYMVDDVSAFDEGKFLAKDSYDKTDSVANAGGIAAYVSKNSTKVIVENSVSSTSKTNAASADAVRRAYSLADKAIPSSQKGVANGVATLDDNQKLLIQNIPLFDTNSVKISDTFLPRDVWAENYVVNMSESGELIPENSRIYYYLSLRADKIYNLKIILNGAGDFPKVYYYVGNGTFNGKKLFSFFNVGPFSNSAISRIHVYEDNSVVFDGE